LVRYGRTKAFNNVWRACVDVNDTIVITFFLLPCYPASSDAGQSSLYVVPSLFKAVAPGSGLPVRTQYGTSFCSTSRSDTVFAKEAMELLLHDFFRCLRVPTQTYVFLSSGNCHHQPEYLQYAYYHAAGMEMHPDTSVANRPRFGCLELPRGACCCLKGPTSA
jgi:hypothetical protein